MQLETLPFAKGQCPSRRCHAQRRGKGRLQMKPTKTWIMIADGARARILENEGPGRGLKAVPNMTFAGDHSATHNIVDDRQGRSYEANSLARSAVEPRSD